MLDHTTLSNAFQPATEVDDPGRFAGRSREVRQLTSNLHQDGVVSLVYGDRGLGKSSLALQIRGIAMGDSSLLDHLGAGRLAFDENQYFLTFYLTCTDATKDFPALLQMMINAAESVEFDSREAASRGHLVDRSTRKKLSLKFVEFESTRNYRTETQRLAYQDLNLEEKLIKLVELLQLHYRQQVLFIIDEVDRLEDSAGLASFLKAASTDGLKFMLVGIGNTIADLLSDHQSLERKLSPVRVPLMKDGELGQIIVKAVSYLDTKGAKLAFSDAAILRLVSVAAGYPWFIHVLAQAALLEVEERLDGEDIFVTDRDVQEAIDDIVNNRFAQQFADIYQMAIRDSYNREVVLRVLAKWPESDIPTSEVYRLIASKFKISNVSVYKNHLCKPEHGEILLVPAFQKRGVVRFRNEMFKAYVNMRDSLYTGVRESVDRAWRGHG